MKKIKMEFHILSLFPEVLKPYFDESILGRAAKSGIIKFYFHQLRDYAQNKHASVDDRPYGGGAGMVFRPEVVVEAVRTLRKEYSIDEVILASPRGELFTDKMARDYVSRKSIMIVCGRYEGVDERAIELVIDREISIGDYVISGGELAAQVLVDAIARHVPYVVGDEDGPKDESHAAGLLEYPHYTRPAVFEELAVPQVLQNGNHAEIKKWREEKALEITLARRPDLIKK